MAKTSVSRGLALKSIAAIPFAALGIAATLSPAQAADNKKQFRPPAGCQVVTGKISPNGWCIAWAKK